MLKKISDASVKIVQNVLPDPFIFCIVLTIVVFIAAMPATGAGPLTIIGYWGAGVWNLLAFSMQMALVLVLGTAMATAPAVKKLLDNIAATAKTPAKAIVIVTVVGTIASWLNWGFGLVVGALLAKSLAKQVKGVDYRLLIASAYSGFVVWHAGISGSIPLQIVTATESLTAQTDGVITEGIGLGSTVFTPWNLLICLVILILMPIVNSKMHPDPKDVIAVDPKLLVEEEEQTRTATTIAEKLEDSRILSLFVVVIGVIYLVQYFVASGNILNSLSLNIVNLIFLLLGILLHGTPINYVRAIGSAAGGAAGVILQFPFYAGIQAMMVGHPEGANSLAGVISNFFVSISNTITFPVWTFLSAGIVNFFVPSGGGQWTVQAPIVLPAAQKLGVDYGVACMSIAWGDAWTNLLQPFWALPALGIAGLGARDIMGYCVVDLILTGIIVIVGFIVVGLVF
jgi:short-chain fatty acids transporter